MEGLECVSKEEVIVYFPPIHRMTRRGKVSTSNPTVFEVLLSFMGILRFSRDREDEAEGTRHLMDCMTETSVELKELELSHQKLVS